ncbi:MAG: OsmC family protein [Flavobacteriaceae bacterium]|jgi:putative redox protein|nr:OsmC family protein [Flavobacteriaceae bacterium]MBT4113752.1 OsmC family protein [Flavobacteriaceae bacterium]MBT4614180.1 OsmC family protein [Flavobacteriaceae bacterium]MBT6635519.1 OsmC family protein [Flavobacteriaceae bacterium]MBT7881657.1 OsmC family protein [Flavobacteriaceae bacterium]|tara:strand:- start:28 stop:444 length:417 start_codon:yes stop_codon:yes gene_type:complete
MTNKVITKWSEGMSFETISPNGTSLRLGSSLEGDSEKIASPKALMLSSLAVCSGIDVVSILEKMKIELKDFKIKTVGSLTQEHPKYYNKVSMEYHFYGDQLDKEKINKAVNLSITKYCGVMEMFRSFAEITTEIYYNS